jgi:hypothetical protein
MSKKKELHIYILLLITLDVMEVLRLITKTIERYLLKTFLNFLYLGHDFNLEEQVLIFLDNYNHNRAHTTTRFEPYKVHKGESTKALMELVK